MIYKEIWLDLETTGTNEVKNGVTQIAGAILLDGALKEKFNFKLQPFPGDVIETKALEVQGITKEDLKTYDDPFEAKVHFTNLLKCYVDQFNKKDKFHFFAYNAQFDDRFLRQFFYKCSDKYYGSFFFFPPLDIMNLAAFHLRKERNKLPNFQLMTVAKYLDIKIDENKAHDAFYDIKITNLIYKKLTTAE